ncbi:ferritin [Anaerofustis stercorihominis]|uniref:Ferritin n=1 Tax=Anaerofustis stercorihominis TaxID=214853 RepID=A0A3E3DX07_9FIRM|nr:ferritin [Anaerofustis stercorihominis]RGD73797.1 ferritin [Anaerofustis stercorihominis]
MLDKKVAELLNDQINKELYSAYIYLDMANFYADYGLDGFENWFYIQAQEERDHAMLIRNYLKDNSHKITSEAIEKPEYTYSDIKDPLNVTLEHEKIVTGLINNIYSAAHDVKDYRTMHFLDWFVNEQMEEEKNAEDNIRKFELFASDPKGLYLLDQEFLGRAYAAPSIAAE